MYLYYVYTIFPPQIQLLSPSKTLKTVTTWYKEDQLAWSSDATSLGSQLAWLRFEPVRLVHLYQRFLTFVFRRSFRFEDSNTTELCSLLTALFIRFEGESFWGVALCVCFYIEISTEVSSRFYQCEFYSRYMQMPHSYFYFNQKENIEKEKCAHYFIS
jgi:hypothetical protein